MNEERIIRKLHMTAAEKKLMRPADEILAEWNSNPMQLCLERVGAQSTLSLRRELKVSSKVIRSREVADRQRVLREAKLSKR